MVAVGLSTEALRAAVSRMRGDDIARDRVQERIREMVAVRLGIDKNAVRPGVHLVDDLGADSLDVVELVMALEDEFGNDIDFK